MASRRPLVNVSGSIRELPTGDTLPGVRELLTAARTYYVRIDGSDSNTGLSNTAGGAFLTIQKAVDIAASLDLSIYDVTIAVAPGSYAAVVFKSQVGTGTVNVIGDTATLTNCTIAGGAGSAVTASGGGLRYVISGFTLTGARGLTITEGATVAVGSMRYGSISARIFDVTRGAKCYVNAAMTITSGMPYMAVVSGQGLLIFQPGITVTLTGTPAFSATFIYCGGSGSSVEIAFVTFSGTATGPRYIVLLNASIYAANAGESYLPGSADGTKLTGGQYA